MISKVFFEILEKVAQENFLEIEDVEAVVSTAIAKGVGADGHNGVIEVIFDNENTKVRIYENFEVVDKEVEGYEYKKGDLSLEESLGMKTRVRIGSKIRKEIAFDSIGRTGVARYKQVFRQELKLIKNKRDYEYFSQLEGEALDATIEHVTDKSVILNIGRNVSSFMMLEDGISGEEYVKGNKIKVVVTKVEETTKGPRVYVNRSQKEIIKRLFEAFIPEVAQGVIDIMSIAREAGNRTKVCVKSNNVNVDAKATCIGMGGMRIKQINGALNGERIDIFEWKENPIKFIAESLTPANCLAVLLDEESRKSIVIVADDQFSLAIGKGGQNVRLASQATGWKIDIKSESMAKEQGIEFVPNIYVIQ